MRKLIWFATILLALSLSLSIALADGVTVTVNVPDTLEGELNGRVLFMLDKQMPDEGDQLYDYLDVTGIPVFGKTVYGLKAGDAITLTADDPDVYGYPMQLDEIPDGEYAVQALFVVYTQFTRSNGSTIWGMADHGGGGSVASNPYNLYSDVAMADLTTGKVELSLTNEIPLGYELTEGMVDQQGNYEDTELVKYVKIKSELLSDFWGCDMYIGANVLLPKNYDESKTYPVLYYQGHWPGGSAPLSYGRTGRASYDEFNAYWDSEDAAEMIVCTIRDANMFYDTSYSVNSENLGPWGDAIVTELIPYLEETFHAVGEPWARALAGGSTGGWESMAMQLFYPDVFGGTWPMCPDGLDFHAYQIVDLYNDDNAYYLTDGWYTAARPSCRDTKGNIRWTIADENHWEIAMGGLDAVSLGQWAIWEAVYGPMDEDGYPTRVWDPITGDINHDVVAFWQQNYDLNYYMQQNWDTLHDKLIGKIHLRGGDMDNYYLNLGQYLVADFLKEADPDLGGYAVTFPKLGHTGNISNKDLVEEIAAHMIQYGPENAAQILGK